MSNLATITNNILADSGIDDINVIVSTGSYANPAWITSLAWTKITGAPLGDYLPLVGGTMTGNINWAQTDRGITWLVNTDGASIKFYNTGDGDTDSRLEFATLDNNNEYFRWVHIPTGGTLYESMRLLPNSSGNAQLNISGEFNARKNSSLTNPESDLGVYSTFLNTNSTVGTGSGIVVGSNNNSGATIYAQLVNSSTNEHVLGFQVRNSLGTSTTRMLINGAGNVGINTPSPNQRLEVNGRIRVSSNGSNGGDMSIDDGGLAFSTQGSTPIAFWRDNYTNQSMRIFAGGNVFIGPSPSDNGARLQVSGTATFSGNVTIGAATAATNVKLIFNGVASKAAGIEFQQSGTPQWYIGNGIASEDNNFELYNSNGTMAMKIIKSTNAINFIGAATFNGTVTASGSGSFMQADYFQTGSTPATSGGIRLGTQVAIRARNVANTGNIPLIESTATDAVAIASGGANVGIGTPSPSTLVQAVNDANNSATFSSRWTASGFWSQLEVRNYSSNLNNQSSPQFRIMHNFNDGVDNGYIGFHRGVGLNGGFLSFGTSGGERLRIFPDGNVLIQSGGTFTDNGARLQVSGNVTTTGNIAINNSGFTAAYIGATSSQGFLNLYSGTSSGYNNGANITLVSSDRSGAFTRGEIYIEAGNASNNTANGFIQMLTGNSPRMTITSAGDFVFKGRSTTTNYETVFYNDNSQLAINANNTSVGKTINFNVRNDQNAMTITSGGNVGIGTLAGSGNRIVVANSGGTLISAVIGSGLAFDGTTLTATGGGSGSISGSGTSGTVALFTGATSIGNSIINQTGGNIGIGTSDNTANYRTIFSNSTGVASFIGITNQTGATGNRALRLGFSAGATVATIQGTSINVADNINIALQAGGANVLIGTTTDSGYRTRIEGSTNLLDLRSTSTDVRLNFGHSGNGGFIGYANIGAGNLSNVFYVTTGAGTIGSGIVMNNSGNLGINTSNPLANLQVGNGNQSAINGAGNKIHIASTGNRSALITLANSSGGTTVEGQFESSAESADLRVIMGSTTNHPLVFRTNNDEKLRITSGGEIQVNSANNIIFGFSGSGIFLSRSGLGPRASLTTRSGGVTYVDVANSSDWSGVTLAASGGNVLVGTLSDNGARLQVSGNATITGTATIGSLASGSDATINLATNASGGFRSIIYRAATAFLDFTNTAGSAVFQLSNGGAATFSSSVTATSFFESSDATLKTLVEDNYQAKGIDSVIAKLYIKNGKEEIGYFAQDLKDVLPSAVSKGSDGLLNLSYREVHTAKIAYLEERIKQLEKKYENN